MALKLLRQTGMFTNGMPRHLILTCSGFIGEGRRQLKRVLGAATSMHATTSV
jgi:hypothetical protein